MKNHFIKLTQVLKLTRMMSLAVLLLGTTLTSCEQVCGFGDDPKPDILYCDTEITVEGAGCASGAFQSRWFKLPNGEWLQPFENLTNITNVEPGQRYKIGYELMRPDNRYDGQVMCLALPPTGKAIRVLCMTPIEEEPTGQCDTYVTAKPVECSIGAWGNLWLQLDNGQYLQPWNNATATQQLKAGARYKIGYSTMAPDNRYNNVVLCAALPADSLAWKPQIVSVNCLEPVTLSK